MNNNQLTTTRLLSLKRNNYCGRMELFSSHLGKLGNENRVYLRRYNILFIIALITILFMLIANSMMVVVNAQLPPHMRKVETDDESFHVDLNQKRSEIINSELPPTPPPIPTPESESTTMESITTTTVEEEETGLFATINSYITQASDFYNYYDAEKWWEVVIVVFTNSFAIPMMYLCYKINVPHAVIIAIGTCVTSTFYHTGETLQILIFGMDHGRWHRLDNIFIILSLQQLFFHLCSVCPPNTLAWADTPSGKNRKQNIHERLLFCGTWCASQESDYDMATNTDSDSDLEQDPEMNYKPSAHKSKRVKDEARRILYRESKIYEWLQWASLFFTLVCQEKAPWVEFYTFLPIVLPATIAISRRIFLMESFLKPSYNLRWIVTGLLFLMCGLFCFIRGLDNRADYLRMFHGFWHLFASLGCYSLFKAKKPLDLVEFRKGVLEFMSKQNKKKVK